MPYSSLARQVAKKTGLSSSLAASILRGFGEVVIEGTRGRERVHFPPLGFFESKYRGGRLVRVNIKGSPMYGRVYRTGPKRVLVLRQSPTLVRHEACQPMTADVTEQFRRGEVRRRQDKKELSRSTS